MVPIGWALTAAGHDVRVLCDPSQSGTVAGAGLTPVGVLEGGDIAVANRMQYYWQAVRGQWPYPWLPLHPLSGTQLDHLAGFDFKDYRARIEPVAAARARRTFDAAVSYTRFWRPDLVLHDPTSLEGLLAAKVTGTPAAMGLWGPTGTEEAEYMRIVPTDFTGSFPRYGLGELSLDMVEHVIDPCPPALAPATAAKRLPVGYVPYNGTGTLPGWLLEPRSRKRVCVAWSTALTNMSGPQSYLLPSILRSLAGLDIEVVITATAQDVTALGHVPDNVRVLERFPLRLLLPSCDAIVHHGGAGTTMTALWAGIPQLALTFAPEQTVNGQRVTATGAGLHMLGHLADESSILMAVRKLLTEPYAQSARSLRLESTRQPTPAELVSTLEFMVT